MEIANMKDKVWHLLQNNEGRYESIGSAVAIKITDNRYIILSAEHVLEQQNICVPCKESYTDKPEYSLLTGNRHVSKKEDWAGVICDKELFDKLSEGGYNYSPIGCPDGMCTFAGFPVSKNKTRSTMVQNRPYSYSGMEILNAEYTKYGLDKIKYIAVHYDQKSTVDSKTGESTQFPDPHGMSGGGIFNSKGELVGIITDQSDDGKIFWGVRLSFIFNELHSGCFKLMEMKIDDYLKEK